MERRSIKGLKIEALDTVIGVFVDIEGLNATQLVQASQREIPSPTTYLECLSLVVSRIKPHIIMAWVRQELAAIDSNRRQLESSIAVNSERAMLPLHYTPGAIGIGR